MQQKQTSKTMSQTTVSELTEQEVLMTEIEQLIDESSYNEAAEKVAEVYKLKLTVLDYTYGRYFPSDRFDVARCIFRMRLERNVNGKNKSYTFKFGQSIAAGSKEPSMYDILACMTKYDVGSFDDFCSNFGYESGTISKTTYNAVCKEYEAMCRLFNQDELEILNIIS